MNDFDALVSMHRCCDARGFTCLHACYPFSHSVTSFTSRLSPPPFFTVSNNDNNIFSTNSLTRILSFLFFFLSRYEMILETATDQVS